MDIHYLQRLVIILICFGILVLEDIVILKNLLYYFLKKEGDSSDEILFYENSLISMAKDWEEIGDIKKFIPIGWLGYSGGYVLYEVSSHNIFLENMDVDGEVEDKPIANSLKELINNMNVNPNIREKEKNKCCL